MIATRIAARDTRRGGFGSSAHSALLSQIARMVGPLLEREQHEDLALTVRQRLERFAD